MYPNIPPLGFQASAQGPLVADSFRSIPINFVRIRSVPFLQNISYVPFRFIAYEFIPFRFYKISNMFRSVPFHFF